VERDPESVLDEIQVVHRSVPQVFFILPPPITIESRHV
jgi:hypothetical protein